MSAVRASGGPSIYGSPSTYSGAFDLISGTCSLSASSGTTNVAVIVFLQSSIGLNPSLTTINTPTDSKSDSYGQIGTVSSTYSNIFGTPYIEDSVTQYWALVSGSGAYTISFTETANGATYTSFACLDVQGFGSSVTAVWSTAHNAYSNVASDTISTSKLTGSNSFLFATSNWGWSCSSAGSWSGTSGATTFNIMNYYQTLPNANGIGGSEYWNSASSSTTFPMKSSTVCTPGANVAASEVSLTLT